MTIKAIWKPYGVSIHTSDITPIDYIAGVTNFGVIDNLTVDRQNVDGSPYPTLTTFSGREEGISVTSSNIDDVIDLLGLGGFCLRGQNPTHDGVKLWMAKWDQCSLVPAAGSVHRYYGIGFSDPSLQVKGLASFESLSCEHRGDATSSFKLDFNVADAAATEAMEEGVNQALPSFFDNRNRYTLGKTTIGGTLFEGKLGLDITSNLQVDRISADSNTAAEFNHMSDIKPVIVIRGIDPTWAIPRTGIDCTHANTSIYLRRRSLVSGVDYVDDATAVHIKFTVKGRAFKTTPASGASNSPSETTLTIYPEYDPGTLTVPIVATTGVAIT